MTDTIPPITTAESVASGHPDKLCDAISDAILDACLSIDSNARVAVETLVKGVEGKAAIVLAGEVSLNGDVPDYEAVARDTAASIGYDDHAIGMDATSAELCEVHTFITTQSQYISQGVDGDLDSQGAGDQGIMFGFACNETPELMPMPITLSRHLVEELARLRQSGELHYLRPDGKSQVTVEYADGKPMRVDAVVISTQHTPDVEHETIHDDMVNKLIKKVVPADLLDDDTKYHINPTGRFVIGGPHGDAGLTGRKIIVDTYGGVGRHGGGAFSGKDPTKVDRSAAYMARYIAKNIVAAGIADRCEVQLSYAIGLAEPTSVMVDTQGTGKVDESKLGDIIRKHFALKPQGIIESLNLRRPIYKETARHGHFGRNHPDYTWERTDKADGLRADAGR